MDLTPTTAAMYAVYLSPLLALPAFLELAGKIRLNSSSHRKNLAEAQAQLVKDAKDPETHPLVLQDRFAARYRPVPSDFPIREFLADTEASGQWEVVQKVVEASTYLTYDPHRRARAFRGERTAKSVRLEKYKGFIGYFATGLLATVLATAQSHPLWGRLGLALPLVLPTWMFLAEARKAALALELMEPRDLKAPKPKKAKAKPAYSRQR